MNAQTSSTLEVDVDATPSIVGDDARRTVGATLRRWLPGLCAVGVALVTAAVTGYRVGHRQLWGDEYATWTAATRNMSEFAHLLNHVDRFLAPYYLFMHGWISVFGDSPTALRLPSVIAISIAAGLIVILG